MLGCLIFSQIGEKWEITWHSHGEDLQSRYGAIFEDLQQEHDGVIIIRMDCRDIREMSIEVGERITINFYRRDQSDVWYGFVGAAKRVDECADLLHELIVGGVAVPGGPTSLTFYKNCGPNVYEYIPPYLTLPRDHDIWLGARTLFREIVDFLGKTERIPTDMLWPFSAAVKADHLDLLKEVEKWISECPPCPRIVSLEDVFDEEGHVRPEAWDRLAFGGCDAALLPMLMPHVFGVYGKESSAQERTEIDARNEASFEGLLRQLDLVSDQQLGRHKRLAGNFRVIRHDVERTDRGHPAFHSVDGVGLTSLTKMLKAYCMLNPPLGYLQGMNDLSVPLILAVCPTWDDKGNPATPLEPHLAKVFWCFARMLERFDHAPLLLDVTTKCQEMARKLCAMCEEVSPLFAAWLRHFQLSNLLWMYSDFVLLYKRTCEHVWDIWLQIACGPDPGNWTLYFSGALLLDRVVPLMDAMPEGKEVSITAVMAVFPDLVKDIDVARVGRIATWLYKRCPPPVATPRGPRVARAQFPLVPAQV